MKKLVLSALLLSQFTFSQVEKEVGDFYKVTAFDQIDVVLVPANENRVELIGRESESVEIINKNGELKIRLPLAKMLTGEDISATVYYKNITAVEANEGSRIASEAVFDTDKFDILAKEGSEIQLKLNVHNLNIRSSNGSKVRLEGNAEEQEVVINSGGIYEAQNLISKDIEIVCNAGGEADIFGTEYVNAKIRAGGTVVVYGEPKKLEKKILAGGTIKEAKRK